MKIENDKWVEIHYTLKNDAGEQLDSSVGNEPLGYVHGRGYLIPGLENLLAGHEPGDKFAAHIEPKDGYGEYDERLIVELDRNKFEFDGEITEGMPFQMMTPQGLSIVHVKKVEGDKITHRIKSHIFNCISNLFIIFILILVPLDQTNKHFLLRPNKVYYSHILVDYICVQQD